MTTTLEKQIEEWYNNPSKWLKPSIQQQWWQTKMIKSWYQPLIMSLEMQGDQIRILDEQLNTLRNQITIDKDGFGIITPESLTLLRMLNILPKPEDGRS